MDNDLMSSLMGILESPDAKDKILSLLQSPKEEIKEHPDLPPPAPHSFDFSDIITPGNMDMMIKLKNAMERLNRKDDHRIGLLNSIRPFLPDGSGRNIDTAIKFIQIMNFAKGR